MIGVGPNIAYDTVASNVDAWNSTDVTLTHNYTLNDDLTIRFRTEGTNTITIYSVCCYQPAVSGGPTWTDLDDANCVLGDADYPDSALALKLLRDNCQAVRDQKVPKANVYNQSFRDWYIGHAAYDANNDRLGNYKFVKRAGVTVLKLHVLCKRGAGNDPTFRAEITGLNGAPAEGAAQEVAITNVAATYPFTSGLTVTWTLHADDQNVEVECGLVLDAKEAASTIAYVPGIYLVESSPSAAITYTNPNTLNTRVNSDILASTVDNARTTHSHLWYYGARQILLADWRFGDSADAYTMNFFPTVALAFNKGMAGPTSPPVSRSLLYSSTGSNRLRVKMGYHTTSGTTHDKSINIQTTENLAGGDANAIDADPVYENATNNTHVFTRAIDGADGRPAKVTESTELDIRSADWEEHYDEVNEPPQCIVQAITANAAEYIIPDYVTVEEVELSDDEFP